MTQDSEIQAMGTLVQALEQLDAEARKRVLAYAATRYGLSPPSITAKSPSLTGNRGQSEAEFSSLAELFDAAGPSTEATKALVAGYWFQELQGAGGLDGQTINSALKDLGHGLSNVTDAMSNLIQRKPALAMQTKKQGTSRQARKKYRLTKAGITTVQGMLSSNEAAAE
jgi:hypothetical protein